jgi:CMP-N,N'-diacetyllegionaminic acid synthase
MVKNQPKLALIPARGGSKGIPRKNMIKIGGRPLVAWTIEAAQQSQSIDEIWLSSDDEDILDLGRSLGVKTLLRPKMLSTDTATAMSVVEHFLASLPLDISAFDPFIFYLQPTSPLRNSTHIDEAFAQMEARNARASISVVEMSISPYKTFKIDQNGWLQSLFEEEYSNARRQDLPTSFIPNGAIYIFQRSEFLARKTFPSNGSHPYIMTADCSIDLDSQDDVNRLKYIMEKSHG